MSKKQVEPEVQYNFDWLKWLVVIAVFAAVAVGNSLYSDQSLFYRVIVGLLLGAVAFFVAAQTRQGAVFWMLAKGSRAEVRRVVWPTKSERNRATIMVVIFVFVSALLLWALDAIFGWLGSLLLG